MPNGSRPVTGIPHTCVVGGPPPKTCDKKRRPRRVSVLWYTLGLLSRPRAQRKQAALKLAAEKAAAEAAAAEKAVALRACACRVRSWPTKARPWLYEASTYLSSYDEWYTFSLPTLMLINNDNNVLQWFMDHARPRVHRPRSALSSRIHAAYLSRVSTVPTVRTVPPSSRSSLFHLDRPAQAMGFFDSIPFMLHAHIMFAFRQQGYCVVLGLAAV